VLREHNPQMTAQLFFVPNRIDPRIGTAEEQEMWRRTDEVFGNFGRVTPVVNSRATLKRTNTFAPPPPPPRKGGECLTG